MNSIARDQHNLSEFKMKNDAITSHSINISSSFIYMVFM